MLQPLTYLQLIFTGTGIVFMILGIPLILKKIAPGGRNGLRIPLTLNHPQAWYPVNAVYGTCITVLGINFVAMVWIIPEVTNVTIDEFAWGCLAFILLGMLLAYFLGRRTAKQIVNRLHDERGSPSEDYAE
jgi:hypothetical protein